MRKVGAGFIAHFKSFFNPQNGLRGIVFGLLFCTLLVLPLRLAAQEPSLQEILDDLGYSINVATDETGIELWPMAESLYMEILLAEWTSLAPQTLSGWYKKHSSSDTVVVFIGSNVPGDTAYYYVTGTDSIGLFIDPINFPESYTEESLCSDVTDHAWVFCTGNPHEFIVAWEDPPLGDWAWDGDYQDRVILFRPADQPPILTVHADFDTFLCQADTICFDGISASDPDYDDSAVVTKIGGPGDFDPATHSLCFLPSDTDSTYEFVFRASDIEGATVEDTVEVTVDINQPPQITAPCSVFFDLPDTATVCFDITLDDPDYFVADVWVNSPGQYNCEDTSICFPAELDTTYHFTMIATDTCGKADTAYTTAVVNYSPGPVVTAPDTVEYELCDTSTVCFDITLYSPDDTLDVSVNAPGEFNPSDSSICFFGEKDTTYEFTIVATDTSGQADTAYTVAEVNFNDPPVVTGPDTVKYDLCDTATCCFAINLYDPDDGLVVWVDSPGEYDPSDSNICFFGDRDTTYNFTIIVTDTCGKADTAYTKAVVDYNQAPIITAPPNVSFDVCDDSMVCFDITLYDPDDGLLVSVNPPGEYSSSDSSVCFLADRDTTYNFTMIATDSCGKADTAFTTAAVSLNQPPELTAPDTVKYDLCDTATVCFDITLSDPDDSLDVSVNPPGQYNASDTSVCFLADADTTHDFTIIVTDSCGKADTAYTTAVVDVNQPPEVTVPAFVDTLLCDAESLCFAVEATDPDLGDTIILEKIEGPGTFAPDTGFSPLSDSICFLPDDVDSTYRFVFRLTDHCGAKDEDTFYVAVDINEAPQVLVSADTSLSLSEPETLCFEIEVSDPEDSAEVSVNSPWYYDSEESSICIFATDETTYCCSVIVTDECDVADTGTMCLTVYFNVPPTVEVLSPPSGDTLSYLPTLSIKLNDDLGLDRGFYQIDSCTGTWTEFWSYNSNSSDTTIDWTVPTVPEGAHTIYFKVTDDRGMANDDTCSYSWSFLYQIPVVSLAPSFLSVQCGHDYILWIYLDGNIVDLDSAFLKIVYEDSFLAITNVLKGPALSPAANFQVSHSIYPDSILIGLAVLNGTFDGPGRILDLLLTPGSDEVVTQIGIEYSTLQDSLGQEIAHRTTGAEIEISRPTSVEDQDEKDRQIPSTYGLSQNYPNPYNLETRIAYQLPQPAKVLLRIYNVRGQLVRTLVNENKPAGSQVIIWDGRDDEGREVSSGIYFYRLNAGQFTDTKKMVLLK